MPNRNGTGPEDQGPLTGRGLGPCNDQPNDDTNLPKLGRNRRWFDRFRGRGRGRGFGNN